ncbi:MAG: chorismate synthase [Clostridium sp.]|nr:chorismate synthase [Clostridium sp.]
MLRFLDAGESHGKGLIAIIEGLPSNFQISKENINLELEKRQRGYGRGNRMTIEQDKVEILSGLSKGKTTGAPLTLFIRNKDYENWKDLKNVEKEVYIPRPGHADLTGVFKYNNNIRNNIERSSARETAIRTAVGAVCKELLTSLGVEIRSKVMEIGSVKDSFTDLFDDRAYTKINESSVRVYGNDDKFKEIIDEAKIKGDTLGGTVYVSIKGVPRGIGSFMHYDRKLDANIAFSAMSIQGVKSVTIGTQNTSFTGNLYHDGIMYKDNKLKRESNNAGGIEGGISNGENIDIYSYIKPIPSIKIKYNSVDLKNKRNTSSRYERSDVTAVVPFSVVLENVMAFEILKAILITFSKDNKDELTHAVNYRKKKLGELDE